MVSNELCLVNLLTEESTIGVKALEDEQVVHLCLPGAPRVKQRRRYHIDVAQLESERVARGSVEERSDSEVKLALEVTLLIVLFHLDGHPLEVKDGGLGAGGVVRAVQDHVHDQLLVIHRVFWELFRRHSALERH